MSFSKHISLRPVSFHLEMNEGNRIVGARAAVYKGRVPCWLTMKGYSAGLHNTSKEL